MLLIKLCYSSKLPMPERLIKKIDNNKNNVNTDKSNGKATYKVDTSNLKIKLIKINLYLMTLMKC